LLPTSAHTDAEAALAEVYNAEDRDHAEQAGKPFAAAYGATWPKAVAKITNDPIESTFATVQLRQQVTKAPGSRAAAIAMALTARLACRQFRPPRRAGQRRREGSRTASSSNDPTIP
jgi:hypothetical protein